MHISCGYVCSWIMDHFINIKEHWSLQSKKNYYNVLTWIRSYKTWHQRTKCWCCLLLSRGVTGQFFFLGVKDKASCTSCFSVQVLIFIHLQQKKPQTLPLIQPMSHNVWGRDSDPSVTHFSIKENWHINNTILYEHRKKPRKNWLWSTGTLASKNVMVVLKTRKL